MKKNRKTTNSKETLKLISQTNTTLLKIIDARIRKVSQISDTVKLSWKLDLPDSMTKPLFKKS